MESVCGLKLEFRSFIENYKLNKIEPPKQILFEILFSGLKNITLKKEFVLIVMDLEVLEILQLWRHVCGAILYPNSRSTWCRKWKTEKVYEVRD